MEELTLARQSIAACTDEPCSTVEQPIDCDITLPDYLNDIQKILKCMAVPGISSVAVSGNRITAEGSVTVRILYLDDSNKIGTYEQGIPFAKYVEVSELGNAVFADCIAKTGYVNCRAVNQRRVDVHGAVSLKFITRQKHVTEVVTGNLSSEIEKRSCPLKVSNAVADAGRYIAVSEVENLKERPAVEYIVRNSAYALVNEVKVIKDKALVKGDLLITVSYTSKGAPGIETYDARLPISQIVDAVGLDDNEIIDTSLRVTQLNVIPKADSSGEYKLLDISAKLLAELHAYKETEFSGLTDAYSTKGALDLEVKEIPVLKHAEKINESILVRTDLGLPEGECSEVYDIWSSALSTEYGFSDGTLEIYGSVTVGIIAGAAGGEFNFYERSIDYSYTKAIEDAAEVYCAPFVIVTGQNTVKNTDGGIDVRIEVSVSANVFAKERVPLISDIKLAEGESTAEDDGAALIIYFASEKESVWDIARKYNTTVGAVMSENELDGDVLTQDAMLLIPR